MAKEVKVGLNHSVTPTVNGTAMVLTDDTRLASDRTRKITVASSAPSSPATGDLWLDTTA